MGGARPRLPLPLPRRHARARRAHLDAPKLKLEVKDGRVETVQVGFDNDVDSLERRMRLTAALATAVRTRA